MTEQAFGFEIGNLYPDPVWWKTDTIINSKYYATVLGKYTYTGRYPEYYTHVLRLSAPKTKNGWLEMSVNLRDIRKEYYV